MAHLFSKIQTKSRSRDFYHRGFEVTVSDLQNLKHPPLRDLNRVFCIRNGVKFYTITDTYLMFKMSGSTLDVKNIDVDFHLPLSHSNRSYQLIELPNGLRSLLISDRSSELFSTSMVVGSGSCNDPNDALGLAHLCEHMLFLGTKTSPMPNQLDQIVSSAGGFTNAYTTMEQTCYHFEVSSFAKLRDERVFIIDSVLEIFSSFFKCPLFKERFIKGEIRAVDEEHKGNTNNTDKILFHALRSLASPNHVFHRFGTGNKATLSQISPKRIQRYLRAYFQRFYLARKMVLVMKGPQSINHLKKLVVAHFSDIPKSSLDHVRLSGQSFTSDHDIYFSPQLYGYLETPILQPDIKTVLLKVAHTSRVRLCYPLQTIVDLPNYRRIGNILCNILGDESENSLCEYLKRKRQWATGVMVFVQNTIFKDDLLLVDIDVTPVGLRNLPQVVDTLHYYINFIVVRSSARELESVIKDYSSVEDKCFMNRETATTFVDEICDYAERLEKGGIAYLDLIRGYADWSEGGSNIKVVHDIQKAAIQCFTEENLRIVVAHEDLSPLGLFTLDQASYVTAVDNYFQYEFTKVLNSEMITFINPDLSLNLELPCIPKPLKELMSEQRMTKQSDIGYIRGMETTASEPSLIKFDRSLEVWKVNNEGPDADTSRITLHIVFRELESTAKNLVGIEVLSELIGEELKYELYHYELVGTFWGIFANVNGIPSILLSVNGARESATFVYQAVISRLRQFGEGSYESDYQKFKKARVRARKRIEESLQASGIRKVFSAAYLILEEGLTLPEEKLDALELIGETDIALLSQGLLKGAPYRQLLLDGDLTNHECFYLQESAIFHNEIKKGEHLNKCSTKLSYIIPCGHNISFPSKGDEDDTANTVLYFIQLGDRSDNELYTWAKLFEHILSYTALDELRTNRRLAYNVFTGTKFLRRTFGIHITIPSGEHDCQKLSDEIERYLGLLESRLEGYTEKDFREEILEPFLQTLTQYSNHMKTPSGLFMSLQPLQGSGDKPENREFMTHWSQVDQIINSTYRFGGTECEEPIDKAFLQSLSLKEFLRYVRKYVSVESPHRTCLIVANAAGSQLYQARKSQFAAMIYSQLQEQNLSITQKQVDELLGECKDQKDFSDISVQLKRYFKESKQNGQLIKVAFKNFAGSLFRSAAIKISARPHRSNSEKFQKSKKTEIRDYITIQGLCQLGKRISWHEKLLALEHLVHAREGTAQAI